MNDLLICEITLQSLLECVRCEDMAYHSEHSGTLRSGKIVNVLVLALMI
jgi:hypothetical protein